MFTPIFPSKIRDAAEAYLRLLDKWNSVHSLTALTSDLRFEALLLDSSALLPHLEVLSAGSVVADFGSGMGIPAVVIALHRPDIYVAAIDRSHKKMAFVRQVALELRLDNLRAICGSAESIKPLNAHLGTAKAVGPLDLILSWWRRHSVSGAPFFAFKGLNWDHSEIDNDWDYEIHDYTLPNLGKRTIVKVTGKST